MDKKKAMLIGGSAVLVLLFAVLAVMLLGRSGTAETPGTGVQTTGQTTQRVTESNMETAKETEDFQAEFEVVTKDPTSGTTAPTEQTPTTATIPAASKPADNTPTQETTKPTEAETQPATKPELSLEMDYQAYMALSGAQQQKLFDTYFADNPLAFADWYKKIKQEYDDENPAIIVTGPIDIEEILGAGQP